MLLLLYRRQECETCPDSFRPGLVIWLFLFEQMRRALKWLSGNRGIRRKKRKMEKMRKMEKRGKRGKSILMNCYKFHFPELYYPNNTVYTVSPLGVLIVT